MNETFLITLSRYKHLNLMSGNVLSCDSTKNVRSIFKFTNRYDIKEADGYGSMENATYWNGMVGLVSREVMKHARVSFNFKFNHKLILLILVQITSRKKKVFLNIRSDLQYLQEKDLAIAALTINSQREEVVDFTVPFYDEVASVVIKVRET